MNSKVIGSIFIVAGTTIGAGMLAMPLNAAEVGFSVTTLQLCLFYIAMLIPALAIAETTQFYPVGTTNAGHLEVEFGKPGYILSNTLLYVFTYSLVCAYINGISDVLGSILLPADASTTVKNFFTIGCVAVFGSIVVFSYRTADILNRVFFYLMILSFITLVALAIFKVDTNFLSALPTSSKVVLNSIPLFFLAYGFHVVIPSLADYLDGNVRQLRTALIIGVAIPLFLFVVWNLIALGLSSQADLIAARQQNLDFAKLLTSGLQLSEQSKKAIQIGSFVFSISALLTSFIGVSLAILSALKENFSTVKKVSDTDPETGKVVEREHVVTRLNAPAMFALAYILPTVLVLYMPSAFLFFLNLAAVIFTIQGLILPMLNLVVVRKRYAAQYQKEGVYRLAIPNAVLVLLSVAFLACSLLTVI